jgi:D-threonate/D-erythronate kinase
VLAIDLDVRERSDAEAYAAMASVAHLECERVLVKIDSTLRGPVRGLIAGALDKFGRERAVMAPAFPEQGRVVRNGRLYVHGTQEASVREVIGDDPRLVIHDADSPEDLQRLILQTQPEWLLVGSAGLARQLAHRSSLLPRHPPLLGAVLSRGEGVLVVAGSPTAITRAQLARLRGLSEVVVLATPPTDTRDSGEAAEALADAVIAWARSNTPLAVVLTGGATARAVIHRLGTTCLWIQGELQPGIPVGALQDGLWHGITVVTKAGGFGTPETLLDLVRALGVTSSR